MMLQPVPHPNPQQRLLISTMGLNLILPASVQSRSSIVVENTIRNTPLPCFWKCTLSTSHLAEVKNEKQRGLLLSLGGGYEVREREFHRLFYRQKVGPFSFFVDGGKILCCSLPVGGYT
ncbi:hypothetical protein ILYODFUR_017310 [Ilyodon furcidens]|uniref:Uncharacterized protein n=1 Tax=Ilyodon furcidens TaxID=33524 RepID=A0ABV0UGS5_9TELE